VDYSDNFTPLESWYVKDEAGFDKVNDILFYDIAASGFGYDFIKRDNETLTGRVGLSYRYDDYSARGCGVPQRARRRLRHPEYSKIQDVPSRRHALV
jgi:hypothetical protein